MKAVLLCAGRGTRLHPLTNGLQKVMLPVAGKPLLEITLDSLKQAKITDVLLVVHEAKEQIIEYFGEKYNGMDLEYIDQGECLGTAHAIGKAAGFADELFLVTYGDEVTSAETFKKFIEKAEQKIGCRRSERPEQYGVLEVEDSYLKQIVEKPKKPKSDLINAGLYLFEPAVFDYIPKTEKSERGEYEITDTIQLMIDDGCRFRAEELVGYRCDFGLPWQLLEINEYFMAGLKHEVRGQVEKGAVLKPPVHVGEDTVIKAGSYIEGPVYIGKNCEIGPQCFIRPYSLVMDNCKIGRAEIKNSILLDRVKAAHYSYIGDSIIGQKCNFGAGTIASNVRHDKRSIKMIVKGKLIDSKRKKLGCVIGPNTKTGANCTIMPGVKIGANCRIGPSVIIYKDINDNTKVIARQDYVITEVGEND